MAVVRKSKLLKTQGLDAAESMGAQVALPSWSMTRGLNNERPAGFPGISFYGSSGKPLNQPSLTYAVPAQVVWWLGNMPTWLN